MTESIIDVSGRPTIEDTGGSAPYLLIERTAGGIIRATFRIYFLQFWTIVLIFALPILPFEVLTVLAEHSGNTGLHLLSLVPSILVGPFVAGALTYTVADLCLGRTPSVSGSYRRSMDKLWAQLLATNMLAYVMLIVGLVMLLVPAVLFFTWYALAPCIVVLEGSWGWAALQRSKALVHGYFWRTLGILSTLIMLVFVFVLGSMVIAGALAAVMHIPPLVLSLVAMLMGLASQPPIILGLVLIYYDLRVRKEAYDSQTLASDLMH